MEFFIIFSISVKIKKNLKVILINEIILNISIDNFSKFFFFKMNEISWN